MIRYLIKNNFKLMMRSVTNILIYTVAPLILVALLSSAFGDMMEKYEAGSSVKAGYLVKGDGSDPVVQQFTEMVKTAAKDSKIVLSEYPDADPKKIISKESLAGFVVFNSDGTYVVYESDDDKYGAKALEYMVGTVYTRAAAVMHPEMYTDNTASAEFPETAIDTKADAELPVYHPDFLSPIEATDYYGIIEVVFFGWCAIVCGAGIFVAEKKYRIGKKLKVSGLSETQLYLAKLIPMLMVVAISSLVTAALTVVLFDVHWGSPALSALILILSAAAATAFGLMFYSITQNAVVSIIAVFVSVWLAGFFGGSFETYMFSTSPQTLKNISPIYHINRALAELSCMGHSDYVKSAVIICIAIIFVSSVLAILAGNIRRRRGE